MRNSSVTQPLLKALRKPLSLAVRSLMGTITGVETSEPVLALTFDDGPHPDYTPRLLEVLDKYRARATFFCLGQFAAEHQHVIRRTVEAGHVVGNHTWDHASLPLLPRSERCKQIRKCAEALKFYESGLFRPPYGQQCLASRLDLLQQGYQVVGWTHAARDWKLTNPKQIMEELLPRIRPGNIVVFHDRIKATTQSLSQFNREHAIEAVRLLLERLKHTYKFVAVSELHRYGRLIREHWYRAANPSLLNCAVEEGNIPSRQYPLPSDDHIDAPYFM